MKSVIIVCDYISVKLHNTDNGLLAIAFVGSFIRHGEKYKDLFTL